MNLRGSTAASLASLAFFACFPTIAQAQLTLLSDNRSVTVSGIAGPESGVGQTYMETESPLMAFQSFNKSLSGSANWTDPNPPYSTPPPAYYQAQSMASQRSSLLADGFTDAGSLSGQGAVPYQGEADGATASAAVSSVFEVTFSLSSALDYTLDFDASFLHIDYPWDPGLGTAPSLISEGNDILGSGTLEMNGSTMYSGTLSPGTYTLEYDPTSSTIPDPLGDQLSLSYNVNFSVAAAAPVPEPSKLLWVGILMLCLVWGGKGSGFGRGE